MSRRPFPTDAGSDANGSKVIPKDGSPSDDDGDTTEATTTPRPTTTTTLAARRMVVWTAGSTPVRPAAASQRAILRPGRIRKRACGMCRTHDGLRKERAQPAPLERLLSVRGEHGGVRRGHPPSGECNNCGTRSIRALFVPQVVAGHVQHGHEHRVLAARTTS